MQENPGEGQKEKPGEAPKPPQQPDPVVEAQLCEYKRARHAHYLSERTKLDDLAFKTSERYDQWVLTIAGGALAISLGFLEKIAPNPQGSTVVFLCLAWVALVVCILAAFIAIKTSRDALYRQLNIVDEKYANFQKTASIENMGGEEINLVNEVNPKVDKWNQIAGGALVSGCTCLCIFAFLNVLPRTVDKGPVTIDAKVDASENLNMPTLPAQSSEQPSAADKE